jgi:hypothetical protein
MGTINNSGQQRHDGQKNYQHSNQRNPDNVRSNTEKHRYAEYEDELTNDQNFSAGKPTSMGDDMDFRDKADNLEDPDNK